MNWFRRRGLFGKYVISFVGLVAFVQAISGAVDMWITYRDTQKTLIQAQSDKADMAARRVEQFIAEVERRISWAARPTTASVDQRHGDYVRILDTPGIAEVTHIGANGKELMRVSRKGTKMGGGDDWTLAAAFREAQTDAAWIGPVAFTDAGPRLQISMAHPERTGVTIAEIELKFLADLLKGI